MAAPICPYLGLQDDPDTVLQYPTPANFCHKARPAGAVSESHQQAACLSSDHVNCPVYLRSTIGPLPPDIAATQSFVFTPTMRAAAGALVLVVVVAALLFFADLPDVLARLVNGAQSAPPQVLTGPTRTPYQPGMADSEADSPVLELFPRYTATHNPTFAACPHPDGWVIYVVKPTDSLMRLSMVYQLSIDTLQQANCLGERMVIRPGEKLFVPALPTPTPTLTPTATVYIFIPVTPVPDQPQPDRPQPTQTQAPTRTVAPTRTWPPTQTPVPPTATRLPPTATQVPPTATQFIPTLPSPSTPTTAPTATPTELPTVPTLPGEGFLDWLTTVFPEPPGP